MGEDVRPGFFAQHKEHQDIEQAQEVDIDRANAFVAVVSLKNGFGTEGHGNNPFTESPSRFALLIRWNAKAGQGTACTCSRTGRLTFMTG
jgi:hypothetical protein